MSRRRRSKGAGLPRLGVAPLLVGVVLVVLLPSLLFGGAVTWQAVEGHRAAAEGRLRDTAQALALALDREVAGNIAALTALATSPAFGPDPASPDLPALDAQARRLDQRLDTPLFVAARDGRRLLSTRMPFGVPLPPTNATGMVERVFATGRPAVADLLVGAISGAAVFTLGVPVLDAEGRVVLTAAATFRVERLRDLLASQALPAATFAALTDARNVVAARTDALHARLVGQPVPEVNVRHFAGRQAGFYRATTLDGSEQVIAFHAVASAPGWTVFVSQSTAAFSDTWRTPLVSLVSGAALAVTAGVALALVAASLIIRPLRRLRDHARRVAAEDAEADAAVTADALASAPVAELEEVRRGFAAAEQALRRSVLAHRASKARLASILETAADGILIAKADGRIVSANPAAARMLRHADAEALIGRRLAELMPGLATTPSADGGAAARLPMRAATCREMAALRRDGSEFPVEVSCAHLVVAGEELATAILRDLTERNQADRTRRLLAREVDHRAKNALAVALSLLRLTPRDDAARFAASVEGRVAAMARAHSLLAERGWVGAGMRELAEHELAMHAGRVALTGPDLHVVTEAVQPLAMLLHELAVNAVRHGALSTAAGSVSLGWEVEREAGRLRLRWIERGGPPVVPPERRGFGSRLLASLAGQQLGGAISFEWDAEGLRSTILVATRFVACDERPMTADNDVAGAGSQSPVA